MTSKFLLGAPLIAFVGCFYVTDDWSPRRVVYRTESRRVEQPVQAERTDDQELDERSKPPASRDTEVVERVYYAPNYSPSYYYYWPSYGYSYSPWWGHYSWGHHYGGFHHGGHHHSGHHSGHH